MNQIVYQVSSNRTANRLNLSRKTCILTILTGEMPLKVKLAKTEASVNFVSRLKWPMNRRDWQMKKWPNLRTVHAFNESITLLNDFLR
jgi:hypothetical protein